MAVAAPKREFAVLRGVAPEEDLVWQQNRQHALACTAQALSGAPSTGGFLAWFLGGLGVFALWAGSR